MLYTVCIYVGEGIYTKSSNPAKASASAAEIRMYAMIIPLPVPILVLCRDRSAEFGILRAGAWPLHGSGEANSCYLG
jgi:hypothetical protein